MRLVPHVTAGAAQIIRVGASVRAGAFARSVLLKGVRLYPVMSAVRWIPVKRHGTGYRFQP